MSRETHIPSTIKNLAAYNAQVMLGLSLPIALKNYNESVEAGHTYITSIFPNYDQPRIRSHELNFPKTEEESLRHERSCQIVKESDIGLALVRPEMYHIRGKVQGFLKNNGFQIVYADERKVDARSYGVLYNKTFDVKQAKPSWPTRTIVYLDSPSFLIVFKDPRKRFGKKPLSEGFFENYKGKEAIEDGNTIRGSVVLQEAIKLGFHKLENEELAMALDPFTALRNIMQLPGTHPHSHLPKEKALLKYNAVSVHIPNNKEVTRDLAVLNNISQLNEIYAAI